VTSLTVDCQQHPDVDPRQLSEQLDSLLSSTPTYGHLASLAIVNSPLTHIPRSVCRLTTLTNLNASRNQIVELPDNCINNLTALVNFFTDENNITRLQDGVFDGLGHLTILRVDKNNIRSIGLRVFNGSAGLVRLKGVWISQNRLTSLEPWFYYIAINGNPSSGTAISLYENEISTFTNVMGLKFPCSTKQMYGELDLGRNQLRHIGDILRGWNINSTELICMMRLSQGTPSIKLRIHENPVICDCQDYTFYYLADVFRKNNLFKDVRCASPPNLYNGEVVSVQLDQFICQLTDRCPVGCRCVHRPSNVTLHVDCPNANITALPLELPKLPNSFTKYKLDFSDNRLRRLEHHEVFVNTSILDVSNCKIQFVSGWDEIAKIPSVNLFGNEITSFPASFGSVNISSNRLNLANNPWDCSCDNKWMSRWLSSIADRLTQDVLCYSPTRLRGKNIIQISDEEFCHDPASEAAKRAWIISLSTVSAVVVVLSFVGVVVHRLRVRLYCRSVPVSNSDTHATVGL